MKKLYFLLALGLGLSATAAAQQSPVSALVGDAAAGRATTVAIRPDSLVVNPDVSPQYPGGQPALGAFLAKNLRYPEQARHLHARGTAYVRFEVSAAGRISNVTVLRGPGYGLNEEALRLVWFMPTWEPARQNGQAVRSACTLPISFE